MKVGFIGLGHLGKAIAGRLVEQGYDLVVWNRTPGKADGLKSQEAESPKALVDQTEIIITCLFDSAAVSNVFKGKQGILTGNMSGKIFIDVTTNHFDSVKEFHDICRNAESSYLEAPVLGSTIPASKGNLTMLVSGDSSAFSKAKSVLDHMASNIFYLKTPGLATKMKLVNNLILGNFMACIAEGVSFAEHIGMAKKDIIEILSVGAGNSLVLNAKKMKLLDEDFSTQFSNALIYKDLHCLMDLAYREKKPLFTGALVKELYAKTFSERLDQEDFSAIYKIF